MKIQPQNTLYQKNQTAFKGIPHARAIVKSAPDYGEIIVYELEKKDIPFLTEMLRNIKLEKLAPEIKDASQLGEWKHLIKEAAKGLKRDEEVYLSTYKNKPCAIMSHLQNFDNELMQISYTASWAIKTGENVKCACKTLFKNIFEIAKSKKKGVCLVMSEKGPKGKRDNKAFYKKLGFQNLDDNKKPWKIVSNKDIPKVIKDELDTAIDFRLIHDEKSVNLFKILNV